MQDRRNYLRKVWVPKEYVYEYLWQYFRRMTSQFDSKTDLDQLLKDTFVNEFRKGHIIVKGYCFPKRYQLFAQAIEDFEVRDDDVWVCSFPKTGTTWTQEMIWCIANNLDFERAKVPLGFRFPFLEFSMLIDYTCFIENNPEIAKDTLIVNSVAFSANQPGPRFIKTHLPFDLLPRQIRTGEKKPKIIYVARNPKDTCISYYHHFKLMQAYRGDFDSFCRLFLGDRLGYTPYWNHLIEFWNKRNDPNVLFLKYEDMKSDLAAVIKKSAAFLNKSVSDDGTKALLEHLSFDNMKRNPAVNFDRVINSIKKDRNIEVKGEFIRSGKVGQWKDAMSKDVIEQFDKLEKEKLSVHNLTF